MVVFIQKKGLDRILAALPRLVKAFPNLLLTIAGDGEPEYEAMLNEWIRTGALEDNVMMTGRLDGTTKWGAYACAELFLLPSRQENFAITVAEAMHMGVPLVISDRVNTWPYVQEAGAGRVLQESELDGSLDKELTIMLGDVNALALMGRSGRKYAQENLTWAGSAARFLKCYSRAVADMSSHD